MEELSGLIENIVFTSDDTGFTVARIKQQKVRELTCIVGVLPAIKPGEKISCQGVWKHHPQHGRQFEVHSFELKAPEDLFGIQKYLESGLIKGIGPVYAEKIIQKFQLGTLEVIDKNPEKLLEIPGIGKKRVDLIRNCWNDQKAIRDVMIFLQSHHVRSSFAQKIYKMYGEKSIVKVQENPYALAKNIRGVGFKTADQLAQNLGIPFNSPMRVDSGIEYVLWELSSEGNTCFPESDLISLASEKLGVEVLLIQERLRALHSDGEIVIQQGLVWIRPLYLAEMGIARELERLSSTKERLRNIDMPKALEWVENKLHIRLAKEQQHAVSHSMLEKVHVITGGPGTGKSTITKAILEITSKLTDGIILTAPTGRAAKRMTEITRKKAFTIHSLLEFDFKTGGFKKNQDNPLECDLMIIDEASMIDTQLMYHLLRAIPSEARVILIGDIDQLPSIGPGNVLKDIISSTFLSVTCLKQIFRQAAGSRIITNAHLINEGCLPDLSPQPHSDFFFIEMESKEEILKKILDLAKTQIPERFKLHPIEEIQILAPMKKGVLGTENLNLLLQSTLNPQSQCINYMGQRFHILDKVMQIRNNYDKKVYNGDIGKIESINPTDQTLTINYDGKPVEYDFSDLDEVMLAYAVSVHKYQGSECPCVIMPVDVSHFKLLFRNLLYTGVTRGKKLVILIGSKKAIALAVKNDEVKKRYTGLKEALLQLKR